MIRPFELVKGRPVPKDQRWVDQPIEGCDEFVVSDIIPTDAIDQALFDGLKAKSLRFGEIDWANSPRGTPFDNYIARRITRSNLEGYSRIHFCKAFTDDDKETPYETLTSFDDHFWPSILLGVRFIVVHGAPIVGRSGVDGRFEADRILARETFIASQHEGSFFKAEFFVSDTPFDIGRHEVPMPGRVSYSFLGLEGAFDNCLHDDLRWNSVKNAIVAYASDGSETAVGGIGGQDFPATNFTEWRTYCCKDKQERVDLLIKRMRLWVTPPPQPEPTIS